MKRELYRGLQWKSLALRREFEPVVESARSAWNELELASVPGERSSILVYLDATELPAATRDSNRAGMNLVPVGFDRGLGRVRCAISTEPARTWIEAYRSEDEDLIGRLLGYPECCRDAFTASWVLREDHAPEASWDTLDGPWRTNGFLRAVGVRLTPWMPCAPYCTETIRRATRYEKVARDSDIDVGSIKRLLEMELTYDAKNGIAFLETPAFRFAVDADPGTKKLSRIGVRHPVYAHPRWKDNGFTTHSWMRDAHRILLNAIGIVNGTVLDLGSGDGSLLAKIPGDGPRVGIEITAAVQARGSLRHPDLDLRVGDFQDVRTWPEELDLVLVPLHRLAELEPSRAANILANLRTAKRIIGYAYQDNIERGDLVALVRKAGLRQASAIAGTSRVQVLEVTTC